MENGKYTDRNYGVLSQEEHQAFELLESDQQKYCNWLVDVFHYQMALFGRDPGAEGTIEIETPQSTGFQPAIELFQSLLIARAYEVEPTEEGIRVKHTLADTAIKEVSLDTPTSFQAPVPEDDWKQSSDSIPNAPLSEFVILQREKLLRMSQMAPPAINQLVLIINRDIKKALGAQPHFKGKLDVSTKDPEYSGPNLGSSALHAASVVRQVVRELAYAGFRSEAGEEYKAINLGTTIPPQLRWIYGWIKTTWPNPCRYQGPLVPDGFTGAHAGDSGLYSKPSIFNEDFGGGDDNDPDRPGHGASWWKPKN